MSIAALFHDARMVESDRLPDPAALLLAAARRLRSGAETRVVVASGSAAPSGPGIEQVFTEAKFLFIRAGAFEVAWGRHRERLGPGDLLCVLPGTRHREQVPPGGTCQVLCAWTAGAEDLVLDVATMHPPLRGELALEVRVAGVHGACLRQLPGPLADPALSRATRRRCAVLLGDLFAAAARRPWQPQHGGNVLATACRRLIEERYAEPGLDAQRLAALLAVHPSSLARAFRRSTGATVAAVLAQRRIRIAQELLLQGELDIATIAARCGFARRDVFTRAFRAATGHPPRAWRRLGFHAGEVRAGRG